MKTKALISCAVTLQLICAFIFAYAKIRFSHEKAPIIKMLFEPRREKTGFWHMRKQTSKPQISCAVTAQLISAFVFATWLVQSLFFIYPKFQASSDLLILHSPVCVGPGRNPEDQFSHEVYLKATNCLIITFSEGL